MTIVRAIVERLGDLSFVELLTVASSGFILGGWCAVCSNAVACAILGLCGAAFVSIAAVGFVVKSM